MSQREQPEPREEGGESQTATSREGEGMDEAHGESGSAPTPPEAGHPHAGEGAGMPDRGAGQAKMDATPSSSTEDQGEATESTAGKKELDGEKEE